MRSRLWCALSYACLLTRALAHTHAELFFYQINCWICSGVWRDIWTFWGQCQQHLPSDGTHCRGELLNTPFQINFNRSPPVTRWGPFIILFQQLQKLQLLLIKFKNNSLIPHTRARVYALVRTHTHTHTPSRNERSQLEREWTYLRTVWWSEVQPSIRPG